MSQCRSTEYFWLLDWSTKLTSPFKRRTSMVGSFKMVNKFRTFLSTSGFWTVQQNQISSHHEKNNYGGLIQNFWMNNIFMRNVEQILNLPLYLWNSFEHSCIFQQLSFEIGDSGCYQDLGPDSCPDVHPAPASASCLLMSLMSGQMQ